MTKILVVDDMPIFRDPIAASLRLAGFESLCASNGREALAAIRAHRPAVVLLDVSMPVMDGISCLRAIRAEPEIARTPVILFTALSDKKVVLEAGKLGVQDYLLKSSFSLKDLLARVLKYTGGQKQPATSVSRPDAAPAGFPTLAAPAAPSTLSAKPANLPAPSAAAPSISPAPAQASSPASARPTAPAAAKPTGEPVPQLLTRDQCAARALSALSTRSLPGAVAELVAVTASPRAAIADVTPIIARDAALSARVLQAANGAGGGSRPPAGTIADAVRHAGSAAVRGMASAVGVYDAMPPSAPDALDAIRCWQHTLAVAMLCERLAPKDGVADPGVRYLVGLCHDLGEILLHTQFGKDYATVITACGRTSRRTDEVERGMLGMNRGELTQTVIGRLGLPEVLKEPIRSFHEADLNPSVTAAALARLLRVAEVHANGMMLASSVRATVAPLTKAECRAVLGRDEPKGPDATGFRTEVAHNLAVLARLTAEQAQAATMPLYKRSPVRICVVREQAFSSFDPVTSALGAMAEVQVVERLADADPARFDGLMAVAPSDLVAGFTAPEIGQAVARPGSERPAPQVLWLVGRINGMTPRGAAIAPRRWPLRLDELAAFVNACGAGATAAGAGGAATAAAA